MKTKLSPWWLCGVLAVSACEDDGKYISFNDAPVPDALVSNDGGVDAFEPPGDAAPIDAGSVDAGSPDAAPVDAGMVDGGSVDAGSPDAAPPPDAMPLSLVAIASGGRHTCAVVSGGQVRCWGYNASGQLGLGHTGNIGDNEPAYAGGAVQVGVTVDQITVGSSHTCALSTSGAVRCWGAATEGQLGYGNTAFIGDDEVPSVAGDVTLGGVATAVVSGGGHHTCALLGGAVRCWGRNQYGQLGYGHTLDVGDDETPASAGDVSAGSSVTQIALGFEHTCALLGGGTVRCWGRNQYGQLGYGNTVTVGDDELPSSVGTVNVGGTVVQLAAGRYHTCALLDTGAVRCWGRGAGGALGYGNTADVGDDEAAGSAGDIALGGAASAIVAGWEHTCALSSGAVTCWGEGDYGRLGYGNQNDVGDDETPASPIALGGSAVQLAAGSHHTCALVGSRARCWGRGLFGRLGYGSTVSIGDDETPASAGDVPLY